MISKWYKFKRWLFGIKAADPEEVCGKHCKGLDLTTSVILERKICICKHFKRNLFLLGKYNPNSRYIHPLRCDKCLKKYGVLK